MFSESLEENRRLKGDQADLLRKVGDAKRENSDLKRQIEHWRKIIGQNGVNNSQAEIERLKKQASDSELILNDLRKRVANLGSLVTENASLKEKIAVLENANTEWKFRINQLNKIIDDLNKRIEELISESKSIDELKKKIYDLKNLIEEKDLKITTLKNEIAQKESLIKQLEDEVNDLNAAYLQKKTTVETDSVELKNLKKMIDALNAEADDYKKKLTEKDSAIDKLKNQVNNLTGEIENLKNLIKKLSGQAQDRDDLIKKIVELQKRIRDLKAKHGFEASSSDKDTHGRGHGSRRDSAGNHSGRRGNRVVATEGNKEYFVGAALNK